MASTKQNEHREDELAQLQRRNNELSNEVVDLKRRIRILEGSLAENAAMNTLPVKTTVTRAVDISLIDRAIITGIASFLNATSLRNLGLTCRQFGLAVEDEEELSLVDEVARQSFETLATKEEREQLPKYDDESHMSLLFQLEELRRQLKFDRLIGYSIVDTGLGNTDVGYRGEREGIEDCVGTAVSRHVMRAGCHAATFSVSRCCEKPFSIGIVRPIISSCMRDDPVKFCPLKDYENIMMQTGRTEAWLSNVHACAYDCDTGECHWTDLECLYEENWDGAEELPFVPILSCDLVHVHLLLDLDKGTLTVFLEASEVAYHDPVRRCLGVMKDGLAGEYSWFVSIHGPTSDSIQIRRQLMPIFIF